MTSRPSALHRDYRPAAVYNAALPTPDHRLAMWLLALTCAALLASVPVIVSAADAPSSAARDAAATAAAPNVIGRVTVSRGRVTARGADGRRRTLERRSPLFEGDVLNTGVRGRVQILFRDGARLSLRPNTEMSLDEYKFTEAAPERDRSRMNLRRGGFRTVTGRIGQRSRGRYRVDTPFAQIGVRGTDWGALAEDVVVIGVNTGATEVSNDGGSVLIGPDYNFAFAVVESPDTAPVPVAEPPVDMSSFAGLELDTSSDDSDDGGGGDVGDIGDGAGDESGDDSGEESGDESGAGGGDESGDSGGATGDTGPDGAGGGEDTGEPIDDGTIPEMTTEGMSIDGEDGPEILKLDVRCL